MKREISSVVAAIVLLLPLSFAAKHNDSPANISMEDFTQVEHSAGVDTAWVRHYASHHYGGEDDAFAIAVDGAGNVYVTGHSAESDTITSFITLKYDASGGMQWLARSNRSGSAAALALDDSGNIYVAGRTWNTVTNSDYTTIKYDSSGKEQWIAYYNSPGNGWDDATALAVDDSGNVYVTGHSYGAGDDDYATVKYDASGVLRWVVRYDGPYGLNDFATALAADDSGNVFVTGWSWAFGYFSDYTTIKYSASGVERWIARYRVEGWNDDETATLAVDDSGNVYVGGYSYSSESANDYIVIKYNAAGLQQWVNSYNGPENGSDYARALAVDDAGNVFVTGASSGSGTGQDFVTVKYSPSGIEQWVARYNGPGNAGDIPTAMAVDGLSNVYVTGYSVGAGSSEDFATVKYDAFGVEQWGSRYNGPGNVEDGAAAIAVDASGKVYVTGHSSQYRSGFDVPSSGLDIATIKIDASGIEQWATTYNGDWPAPDWCHAIALVLDGSGNIYVTGYSAINLVTADIVTIKYDALGSEQWVASYKGAGNGWDQPAAIAVDFFGNVFVAGMSDGAFATIKYDPAGVQQWVALTAGPGDGVAWFQATAFAIDAAGSVHVTGYGDGLGIDEDYITFKYDTLGNRQWLARYNGPGNAEDRPIALTVDEEGNAYVTGYSTGAGTKRDFATIKYNAAGVEQWVARYDGPAHLADEATAIALDDSGNAYVTGWGWGGRTHYDFTTIKYNPSGQEQWVARFGMVAAKATALAVDGLGNVFVIGNSVIAGSGSGDDYTTVKYNANGAEQWVARYDGPAHRNDQAVAIAVDNTGSVYVTGITHGTNTNGDYTTVKYDPLGVEQWVVRYDGPENTSDQVVALAVDSSTNVYVTGTSTGIHGSVFTTIKYTETATPVTLSEPGILPAEFALQQNYPNPFNPTTTIEFALPKMSLVTLKIYDLLGNEVSTLVAEKLPAGKHRRVWEAKGLASGVYLYRIEAGEFIQTKKLILLR
jgi:uncharacterized delta-60 repeat protein